jgi:hypothetical protein
MSRTNMWDLADIIMSDRTGENIGRGITTAAKGISEGMIENQRRNDDLQREIERKAEKGQDIKEQRKRTTTMLEAMDPEGAKSGRYHEASLGELLGAVDAFAVKRTKQLDEQAAAQAYQESQLRKARMDEIAGRQAQQTREQSAFQTATAPIMRGRGQGMGVMRDPVLRQPSVAEMIQTYGQSGGSNPEMLQAFKSLQPKSDPKFITDPETGIRIGVDASGNMQQLKGPEAQKPALQSIDVGGKKMFVGPGNQYFDESGAPVQTGRPSAPRPPDPLLKSQDPQLYDAMRQEYLDHLGKSGAPSGAPAAAAEQPIEIGGQAEFDKLPKGARFIFNGRAGVKK